VEKSDKSIQKVFEKRIVKTDSCWYFSKKSGSLHKQYPKFMWKGESIHAHRLSYLMYVGNISGFLNVYRNCGDNGCINPEHLFAGDARDAAISRVNRGSNPFANKTHCMRGHEFTQENTRVRIVNGRPNRSCKACVKVLASSRSH
jgi:hypothetical protein